MKSIAASRNKVYATDLDRQTHGNKGLVVWSVLATLAMTKWISVTIATNSIFTQELSQSYIR